MKVLPKVMTPLGYAMSFIDRYPGEFFLFVDNIEAFSEPVTRAELRCHVQKASSRMARLEVTLDAVSFMERGVTI